MVSPSTSVILKHSSLNKRIFFVCLTCTVASEEMQCQHAAVLDARVCVEDVSKGSFLLTNDSAVLSEMASRGCLSVVGSP